MVVPGPGCGHVEHPPHCECDVVIRTIMPIRSTPYNWYDGVLVRAGIDLSTDPSGWDYVVSLLRAEEAKVRRAALGLGDRIDHYTDGRKLLRAYLAEGGWTSELYEDDVACATEIGPEFTWQGVLALWTTRNTRGVARINVWDRLDWQNFEQCVIEREPVTRALSRELGISRTTIETMYAMHGVTAGRTASPGDPVVGV